MRRWFWVGVFTVPLVLLIGVGVAFGLWQRSDIIAWGVRVNAIAVGGQKAQQAKLLLAQAFSDAAIGQATAMLTCQGKPVHTAPLEHLNIAADFEAAVQDALMIGRRTSLWASLTEVWSAWRYGRTVPLHWRWDKKQAKALLQRLALDINRPPQRAWVDWRDGQVRIVPSQDGIELAIDETLQLWDEQIAAGQWQILPLNVRTWRAEVTTDKVAMIDGVVGQATTSFSVRQRNRTHNIRLTAKRLDHVFIPPGETISFNESVGPRTRKQGFRIARVLVRGQFTEDFGGGVCQVAGTLYNAALRAGMEIVERHRHSRPIGYLPAGLDATVNFGTLDLKLRNPFPTPLYLRAFVKGGRLNIIVLGKRQDGAEYRLVRQVQRWGSGNKKIISDPSLPPTARKVTDKGSGGYRVVVWRLRLDNGVVTQRERISNDTYALKPRLIRVGMPSAKASPPSAAKAVMSSTPQPQPVVLTEGFSLSPSSQNGETAPQDEPSSP